MNARRAPVGVMGTTHAALSSNRPRAGRREGITSADSPARPVMGGYVVVETADRLSAKKTAIRSGTHIASTLSLDVRVAVVAPSPDALWEAQEENHLPTPVESNWSEQ